MTQPTPGRETVLVVEDETAVRGLVVAILLRQGYVVLEASSATEALLVSEAHGGTIHLLISDLSLPGINGPTLAAQLTAVRPGLQVLFLSGYAAEDAARGGLLPPHRAFLQKPFGTDVLSGKVRELLNLA
jgi:two-component system, cell cycle sensor histidine kinase and response regulator CckA